MACVSLTLMLNYPLENSARSQPKIVFAPIKLEPGHFGLGKFGCMPVCSVSAYFSTECPFCIPKLKGANFKQIAAI